MAWKRLDEVTNKVVSRLVVDGEDAAATVSVNRENGKRAASAKPAAKVTGQRQAKGGAGRHSQLSETTANTGEVSRAPLTMSRGIFVASKARRPTSATNIPVFRVVEGGRPDTGGGGTVPAGHTRDNGREPARELKLVWVR